jgi:hypothetical protein
MRFDHVARFIVNAMISTRLRSRKRKKERELLARAPYELILYLLSYPHTRQPATTLNRSRRAGSSMKRLF